MLEIWKTAIDKGNVAGALLTDLSKAFDCLNHELLIAKLDAYGFDNKSISLIYNYLSERKQRTRVITSFSNWSGMKSGVPQGSILGPLLFNIYLNDIFYFVKNSYLASYADDNTPYAGGESIEYVLKTLKDTTEIMIMWFNDNYFKMNSQKCKLLTANHGNNVSIIIDKETITDSVSVKLLGITIDNKLNFKEHITKLCKTANLKLHALARISHLLNKNKLRTLMKAFIESQFSYCPLIWMFHNRALNNKINKVHERALRIVYKNSYSSFQELLDMDSSFTIHHRNLQKLAIEMYKVKNNISPSFMHDIFPFSNNIYNLRNDKSFKTSNVRTVHYGTETIRFRGPQTWNLIPEDFRNATNLKIFKSKIKKWNPVGCKCRICRIYVPFYGFI